MRHSPASVRAPQISRFVMRCAWRSPARGRPLIVDEPAGLLVDTLARRGLRLASGCGAPAARNRRKRGLRLADSRRRWCGCPRTKDALDIALHAVASVVPAGGRSWCSAPTMKASARQRRSGSRGRGCGDGRCAPPLPRAGGTAACARLTATRHALGWREGARLQLQEGRGRG